MKHFLNRFLPSLLLICLLFSCYSSKWADGSNSALIPPPQSIQDAFGDDMTLEMACAAPGTSYHYDISEKDLFFDSKNGELVFNKVNMILHEKMLAGQVLVDVIFYDDHGNHLKMPKIDLMRIVPTLDTSGEMAYPEYLLEEFSRFGVSLRKEHKEYLLSLVESSTAEAVAASQRAYRANLVNNCLDPTKWEMQLTSEDYRDFEYRLKGAGNFNQNKNLAHSWFYLDKDLYRALLTTKNGNRGDLFDLSYKDLSDKAETVVIDLSKLRPPAQKILKSEVLEIGHRSGRKIRPIDKETFYKWRFGLLGQDTLLTYGSIGDRPRKLAKFENEGFYTYENANTYDFSYVNTLEDIVLRSVETSNSNCHVEISINGPNAPYKFVIGNIDLALLQEQKMLGIGLGINPYPKSRRYNPQQATLSYDPDFYPQDKRPYALMLDTNEDKWVNNQYKGVEKVYLSYESIDENVLEIYLLSYERELPIWMSRIKLEPHMREMIRARRNLYN